MTTTLFCTTKTSNSLVTHYFYGGIIVYAYPIFCFLCSCSPLFFTAAHFFHFSHLVILHWHACGADGRSLGRSLGVQSRDYQIFSDGQITTFLSYGAPPTRGALRRVWSSAKNLSESHIETLKDFYKHYQKKFWYFKKSNKRFKLPDETITISGICLVIIGTITGGMTLNPIILGRGGWQRPLILPLFGFP